MRGLGPPIEEDERDALGRRRWTNNRRRETQTGEGDVQSIGGGEEHIQ